MDKIRNSSIASRLSLPSAAQGKRGSHFDAQEGGNVLVPQDAWTILHHCWSPHEFVNLGGSNNLTAPQPGLPPLNVPGSMVTRPTDAAIQEPVDFQSLHHMFSPALVTPLEDPEEVPSSPESSYFRGDCLAKPHTKVTCINVAKGDSQAHHLRMQDVVGKVDFFALTAGRRAADALCHAVTVEDTFRLSTSTGSHGLRRVVVDRAQTHFFILFEAIHAVFPELGCPTVTKPGDICDLHVDGLVDLVSVHSRKICGFLPILYFLFETNLRQFALYFSRLSDQFEARMKEEQQPFDTTSNAKKLMGFLSFGFGKTATPDAHAAKSDADGISSHDVLQKLGDLSSAPDLIADNHMALPERFIVHFSNTQENHRNTQIASAAATTLYMSLTEETDALLDVVESLGELDDRFYAPPPCLDEDDTGGSDPEGKGNNSPAPALVTEEAEDPDEWETGEIKVVAEGEEAKSGDQRFGSAPAENVTDVTAGSSPSCGHPTAPAAMGEKQESNLMVSEEERKRNNRRREMNNNASRMTVSGQELQSRSMMVHNLMHNAVTHQQYGAIPIVQTMVVSMQMTNFNAQTSRAHSLRPLLELKTLPEREKRLLSEGKKQNKDHNMMSTMTNVVVAQRDRLTNYRACFFSEVDRMRSKRVDALRSVCIYVAAMTSQLSQCYWQDEALPQAIPIDSDLLKQRRWYDLVGIDEATQQTSIKNGLLLRLPDEEFPTQLPRDPESGEIICGGYEPTPRMEKGKKAGSPGGGGKPRSNTWYAPPTQTVGQE